MRIRWIEITTTHVKHVLAHVLVDELDWDTCAAQLLLWTNTRAHEDLRCADRAGADDDFLARLHAAPRSIGRGSELGARACELAVGGRRKGKFSAKGIEGNG